MSRLSLRVTLLSDAAFTVDSATTGPASTLGYVPGATLYGAAAAALAPRKHIAAGPARLSEAAFFRAFIEGAVRFSDALPEVEGEIALPIPLSLHTPKGGDPKSVVNLARAHRGSTQLEQLRSGFLTPSLLLHEPHIQHDLRTAIGPDGRARDRHLYGLATLRAGLSFRSTLASDDDELLTRVSEALVGRVRLGRSRTAELGVSEISLTTGALIPVAQGPTQELVLLCTSDLALRDPTTGAPILAVSPSLLGLPADFVMVPERTFIRTRRYSPFNGHRRKPELERQVIVAGSVITVRAPDAIDRDQVRRLLANGVGCYRNQGLGRVLVDPLILAENRLTLREPAATPRESCPIPTDALGSWVAAQVARRRAAEEASALIKGHVEGLARYPVSRSQWGRVREIARAARRAGDAPDDLLEALSAHLADGESHMVWSARRGGRSTADALRDALASTRNAISEPGTFATAVELLASNVARVQAQKEVR